MSSLNKKLKLQQTTKCPKHPNIIQSIGKGGSVICRQCKSDIQHQRDIKRNKLQTTYSKPNELLTPMGNNIR